MGVIEEHEARWFEWEHEELVSRLRRLQWPQPSADARRRCWERMSERMAEHDERHEDGRQDGASPQRQSVRRSGLGQRHEFSRPQLSRRIAAGEGMARLHRPRSVLSVT